MPEENGLTPLVIDDFTGGLTDHFLGGAINKYEVADNKIINNNKDLETRPGTLSKYTSRTDATYQISHIIDHNDDILTQCGPDVHYFDTTIQTIKSINNHSVFSSGDDTSKVSTSYWNGHTLAVSDEFTTPQRIYKDENDSWVTENLGLPEIIYASSISLANDLKTLFNAHIADISEHSSADTTDQITASDASDLLSLITLTNALTSSYKTHEKDAALASGWSYHIAQEASSHALSDTADCHTLFACYARLKALKTAFNAHDADTTAHTVGSLHQSSTSADPTASGTSGSLSYLYGFHFKRSYFIGNKEFIERGPVYLLSIDSIQTPDTDSVTISDIPELTSGDNENWSDSDITISIYRTIQDGSTLFYLSDISNGTTSYTDSAGDDTIKNNATAYTEGGVLDNNAPPPAEFCDVIDNRLCVANVKIGDVVFEERFMMGNDSMPSSMPSANILDFESGIKGLGHVSTYPIVFLKDRCYRVEGSFDSKGAGSLKKYSISQEVGLVSPESIIQTDSGIFFAAENGFYFTNGYSVQLISTDREDSYKSLLSKESIKGTFHKSENWILFAVKTSSDTTGNDTIWCGNYKFRTPEGGVPFTTWSGGHDADNFSATSLAYIDGVLYRGDHRGYLLYHDSDTKTDIYVDVDKTPDNWFTQTITYDLRSVAFDFGNAQVRKWVPKININCDNVTSLNMLMESDNDNSGVFNSLKEIKSNGNIEWGDRTVQWGDTAFWDYNPVISEWRFFPANELAGIRCMYKQVKFSNNYITVDSSNSVGTATVDASAKTVTLDNYPTNQWIDDPVNYFISFSDDDYTLEFKIVDISSGILTLEDNNTKLTDKTSVDWMIKGYKKGETLRILNFVISFREITMSQKTYSPVSAS